MGQDIYYTVMKDIQAGKTEETSYYLDTSDGRLAIGCVWLHQQHIVKNKILSVIR
jgi:hypothetical protein